MIHRCLPCQPQGALCAETRRRAGHRRLRPGRPACVSTRLYGAECPRLRRTIAARGIFLDHAIDLGCRCLGARCRGVRRAASGSHAAGFVRRSRSVRGRPPVAQDRVEAAQARSAAGRTHTSGADRLTGDAARAIADPPSKRHGNAHGERGSVRQQASRRGPPVDRRVARGGGPAGGADADLSVHDCLLMPDTTRFRAHAARHIVPAEASPLPPEQQSPGTTYSRGRTLTPCTQPRPCLGHAVSALPSRRTHRRAHGKRVGPPYTCGNFLGPCHAPPLARYTTKSYIPKS